MNGERGRTAVMIMAGGRGSRLGPLTCHRSKPAVPFGGRYRIIDFVLSNFINSGYRRIFVLTQYMASSLIKHLNRNWRMAGLNEFIEIVPAQMRLGDFWYRGTADSVLQNLNIIRDEHAAHVAVFGGDHIYTFAIDQMDEFHRDNDADLTVAAFPVPRAEAHQFGVMNVDADGRIVEFVEKPADPPCIPGRPEWSLVSMGNYFFRTSVLEDAVARLGERKDTKFDFGGNVLPDLISGGARVLAYDFGTNHIPGEPADAVPYWRDVGTLDSYFQANMDLRERLPPIDVYNRDWRIRTAQRDYPPARLVQHGDTGVGCHITDSMVCEGSIVTSAKLTDVVLGYDCFVHARSEIETSVLLSGCDIGAGARLRRVLCDKNCRVAPKVVIGHDLEADRKRFPFVTDSGIVVLPKGTVVPPTGPVRFAYDIVEQLQSQPDLREQLDSFDGEYQVSARDRHSYVSAGPRYQKFGPQGDEL